MSDSPGDGAQILIFSLISQTLDLFFPNSITNPSFSFRLASMWSLFLAL